MRRYDGEQIISQTRCSDAESAIYKSYKYSPARRTAFVVKRDHNIDIDKDQLVHLLRLLFDV